MMAEFETTPLLSSFKFPDQDFLAHFFAGKRKALGWQYNALKTMKHWHPNIWRDGQVVCLHYVVDKPRVKRVGEDGIAGYKGRDGITHSWWDALLTLGSKMQSRIAITEWRSFLQSEKV